MNECDRRFRSKGTERTVLSLKFTCESASCSVPQVTMSIPAFPRELRRLHHEDITDNPLGIVRSLCEELSPRRIWLRAKKPVSFATFGLVPDRPERLDTAANLPKITDV
jgi:hypothetical protein